MSVMSLAGPFVVLEAITQNSQNVLIVGEFERIRNNYVGSDPESITGT